MNPFLTAFLIVSGILSPFILIALFIYLLNNLNIWLSVKKAALEIQLEELKKAAPYDDIELSQPPNPTMFTIRLIKNKEVVYEGSYNKEFES